MSDHDCGPLIDIKPSVFPGAPPVRTFEDGCQEYGPYVPAPCEWSYCRDSCPICQYHAQVCPLTHRT